MQAPWGCYAKKEEVEDSTCTVSESGYFVKTTLMITGPYFGLHFQTSSETLLKSRELKKKEASNNLNKVPNICINTYGSRN